MSEGRGKDSERENIAGTLFATVVASFLAAQNFGLPQCLPRWLPRPLVLLSANKFKCGHIYTQVYKKSFTTTKRERERERESERERKRQSQRNEKSKKHQKQKREKEIQNNIKVDTSIIACVHKVSASGSGGSEFTHTHTDKQTFV